MKKCPKCGTILDDSKKKCYMCGATLTQSQSVKDFSSNFDRDVGAATTRVSDNVFNNGRDIDVNAKDIVDGEINNNGSFFSHSSASRDYFGGEINKLNAESRNNQDKKKDKKDSFFSFKKADNTRIPKEMMESIVEKQIEEPIKKEKPKKEEKVIKSKIVEDRKLKEKEAPEHFSSFNSIQEKKKNEEFKEMSPVEDTPKGSFPSFGNSRNDKQDMPNAFSSFNSFQDNKEEKTFKEDRNEKNNYENVPNSFESFNSFQEEKPKNKKETVSDFFSNIAHKNEESAPKKKSTFFNNEENNNSFLKNEEPKKEKKQLFNKEEKKQDLFESLQRPKVEKSDSRKTQTNFTSINTDKRINYGDTLKEKKTFTRPKTDFKELSRSIFNLSCLAVFIVIVIFAYFKLFKADTYDEISGLRYRVPASFELKRSDGKSKYYESKELKNECSITASAGAVENPQKLLEDNYNNLVSMYSKDGAQIMTQDLSINGNKWKNYKIIYIPKDSEIDANSITERFSYTIMIYNGSFYSINYVNIKEDKECNIDLMNFMKSTEFIDSNVK